MHLILLHDDKIPIWDVVQYICIGQIESVHERSYLPQKAIVTYNLGFAISTATFLDKTDSFVKFPTERRE